VVAACGDASLAQPLAGGLGLFAREAVDLQGVVAKAEGL
jgi:hypothetical protein